MKSINPVLLAMMSIFNGIATAILSANHVFEGRLWIAWCLWGLTGALMLWAVINLLHDSKREQENEAPRSPTVVQDNKQTVSQNFSPTLNIGYPPNAQPRSAALVLLENEILKFMKGRPHGYYEIEQIAGHIQMTHRQTWDLLEELERKGRVHRGQADVKGGAIWTISDLEL